MSISIPPDENLLERLTSRVSGKVQEFVLTDRAVYFEGQRSPLATWLGAILFPLGSLLGLGLFYMYLRDGRLFVRHSLDRIDAVTTRKIPLPIIANVGGLVALLFGVNAGLQTYDGDLLRSILIGYGVAAGLCLGATFLLLRFQLSSLSVNALNGNFTFETFRSFAEVQRVQERIWQARAELATRAKNLPVPGQLPSGAPPTASPEPSPKGDRRPKRR